MQKSGRGVRSVPQLLAFPTDGQGRKLVTPSAIKKCEVAQAKGMGQDEAKSLLTIVRNLDRLSSGGHDISRAIGLAPLEADDKRLASDRSLVSRAMKALSQVLESTIISESKLVIRQKK